MNVDLLRFHSDFWVDTATAATILNLSPASLAANHRSSRRLAMIETLCWHHILLWRAADVLDLAQGNFNITDLGDDHD